MKDYHLIERRGYLQSIRADERLIENLQDLIDSNAENESMKSLLVYLKENTQERRKGMLQAVRKIERMYNISPDKKVVLKKKVVDKVKELA